MDRRTLLAGLAVIGTAPIVFAQETKVTMADASPIKFMDVKKAPQFFMGVLPRAELSLVTSQIASEMATNKDALEFAGFELAEAITVDMVLKDMGVTAPTMDADLMKMADMVKTASPGAELDRAYIALQLQNHENLRDLADTYLTNSLGATDPKEKHGRHVASLLLGVFKEHTAICKRISKELGA